jgi:hypothetical protein
MVAVAALGLRPASSRNSVPRPGIVFASRLDSCVSASPLGWSLTRESAGGPQLAGNHPRAVAKDLPVPGNSAATHRRTEGRAGRAWAG